MRNPFATSADVLAVLPDSTPGMREHLRDAVADPGAGDKHELPRHVVLGWLHDSPPLMHG
jgi:hypothetical protein